MYKFDKSISIPRKTKYRQRTENIHKYVATGSCYNATMSEILAITPLKFSDRWQHGYENYSNENNETINNQEALRDELITKDLSVTKNNNLENDVSNTESELSTTNADESYSDTTTKTDDDDDDNDNYGDDDDDNDKSVEYKNKFTHTRVILQYCTRDNISHKATKHLLSLIKAITPSISLIIQMNMIDSFKFFEETK